MSRWGNLLVLATLAVSQTAFAQILKDPHDPNQPIAPYAQPKSITNMSRDSDHVKEVKIGETEEFTYTYDQTIAAQSWGNCLDADVWVLVDYSDSMSGYEPYIASALKEIATGLLYTPTLRRLGLITFHYSANVEFKLTNNYKTAMTNIARFAKTQADNGTDINRGLLQVTESQNESKPNENAKSSDFKKILILISDGEDLENREKILATARKFKADGWWIYSIMASSQSPNDKPNEGSEFFMGKFNLLKGISGNPNDENSYYVDSIGLKDLPQHFREKFSCM